MNSLLWMLADATDGSGIASGLQDEAKSLWKNTVQPIVSTVLWVLVAILAVVFIFKAVTTSMAVMKAADEPQVRQEKLNGFKYLAIGLGVAIVVLSLANVIMGLVTKRIPDVQMPDDTTSFLF